MQALTLTPRHAISMDMKIAIDDSFTLDGSSFSCPSSTSSSFSSNASSTYDVFTPTSGCSTPLRRSCSSDFDASFCSDNTPYELTPPGSANTCDGYFPMELRPTTPLHHFMNEGHPSTPSPIRYQHGAAFDDVLASQSCMSQIQGLPLYPLGSTLATPPLMFPTPQTSVHGSSMMDMSEMWSMNGEVDNMSMFEDMSPQSHFQYNRAEPEFDLHALAKKTKAIGGVLAKQQTRTLQTVLHAPHAPVRVTKSRTKTVKARNAPVTVAEKASFPCREAGCPKKYARAEHEKRHWLA